MRPLLEFQFESMDGFLLTFSIVLDLLINNKKQFQREDHPFVICYLGARPAELDASHKMKYSSIKSN